MPGRPEPLLLPEGSAGAAAAPAGARRGPPLRAAPPPRPPRQGHDDEPASTRCPASGPSRRRRSCATSARRTGSSQPAGRSWRPSRGCRRSWRARSTTASTRPPARGRGRPRLADAGGPRRVAMELTVITGMSGAGKSQAMGAFEDAGWFCVDNLPPGLLPALADLFTLEGSRVDRAAVVCDVRGGVWFGELGPSSTRLQRASGVRPRVRLPGGVGRVAAQPLPRDPPAPPAGRRRLGARGDRARARGAERGARARRRGHRHHRPDDLGPAAADRRGADAARRPAAACSVEFVSFGYKHGVPRDADLLFDVRFLRNPHYVPELPPLTGLRRAGGGLRGRRARRSTSSGTRLEALLDFLLPAYAEEGKTQPGGGVRLHRRPPPQRRPSPSCWRARYGDGAMDVGASHRHIARRAAPRRAPRHVDSADDGPGAGPGSPRSAAARGCRRCCAASSARRWT